MHHILHQDATADQPTEQRSTTVDLDEDAPLSPVGAPQLPDDAESSPRWHAPCGYRDYRLLWLTNIAEFVGRSMSAVALSVWLYEASGSGMVLGGLGAVAMVIQVPTIPLGGVLADELDRKKLIPSMLCGDVCCERVAMSG